MRKRQMIRRLLMANSRAIELRRRDARPNVVVDVRRSRMARPAARESSGSRRGDYEAAKALFETYGVHSIRAP